MPDIENFHQVINRASKILIHIITDWTHQSRQQICKRDRVSKASEQKDRSSYQVDYTYTSIFEYACQIANHIDVSVI